MVAEGEELFHYLTENDRANSMPPEITVEMYQNVVDPKLFLDTSVSFAPEGKNLTFFFFFKVSSVPKSHPKLRVQRNVQHQFVGVLPLEW